MGPPGPTVKGPPSWSVTPLLYCNTVRTGERESERCKEAPSAAEQADGTGDDHVRDVGGSWWPLDDVYNHWIKINWHCLLLLLLLLTFVRRWSRIRGCHDVGGLAYVCEIKSSETHDISRSTAYFTRFKLSKIYADRDWWRISTGGSTTAVQVTTAIQPALLHATHASLFATCHPKLSGYSIRRIWIRIRWMY